MKKRYVVRIKGELISVTEDVYKAFYSSARQERTQLERDIRNRLVHYDAWDTDRSAGAEAIRSPDQSPEERIVGKMSAEKLTHCLKKLDREERELIHALYYCGETLSSLARRLNIPRKTLEGRRDKILRKLRILFEAPDR